MFGWGDIDLLIGFKIKKRASVIYAGVRRGRIIT